MKRVLAFLMVLGGTVGSPYCAMLTIAAHAQAAPRPVVIPTIPLPGGSTGLNAMVGGHDGLFVFDAGAGLSLVTPQTAHLSGCRPWGQVTGFRATGERIDV